MKHENPKTGEIVTFYSYKGGTGRTLALANVACLLAKHNPDEKILMVDWDLEAPGLHRYFRDHVPTSLLGSWNRECADDEREGLMDLFVELERRTKDTDLGSGDATGSNLQKIYDNLDLKKYIVETDIFGLHLMKAGRFGPLYANTVNTFNWAGLFSRSEWLIRLLADQLKRRYRYVLIDSRTGITDTSGICTTLLPDMLVVVFTTNRQSLTGIKDLVQSATDYRRTSGDIRPLMVYPLVSRVENNLPTLREHWRFNKDDQDLVGFQPMFEELLKKVYGIENCDLQRYFDEVQIQYIPDYAYGEEIAVLIENQLSQDRFSLTRSFETLCERLESQSAPWAEVRPQSGRGNAVSGSLEYLRSGAMLARMIWRRHRAVIAACLLGLLLMLVSLSYLSLTQINARYRAEMQAARSRESSLAKTEMELSILRNVADERLAQAESAAIRLNVATNALTEARKLADTRLEQLRAAETNSQNLAQALLESDSSRTNLVATISNLKNNLSTVEDQNARDLEQLGWRKVVTKSLLTILTDRPNSLQIADDLYLWPVGVRTNALEFIINSKESDSHQGTQYLHDILLVGASTTFTNALFEYRVTLNDLVIANRSLVSNKAGLQFSNPSDSTAVFSVYKRWVIRAGIRG